MNKLSIFATRRALRVQPRRKGPEDHENGSQQGTGDNNGVNSGNNGNTSDSGDNTGDDAELAAFWGGSPGDDGNNSDSSDGSDDSDSPGGTGDTATELGAQLDALNFGQVFDPNVVTEINNGDFTNFNTRMNGMMQNVVRQSLLMNVQVMRQYGERLVSQMREEFSGTLDGRDDQAQLIRDFPAAANPLVAPMIQQVYGQALKNAGGDRAKAVAQTKKMIGLMARNTGADLGLNVAPRSENDAPPTPVTNWVDELMSR